MFNLIVYTTVLKKGRGQADKESLVQFEIIEHTQISWNSSFD